jgi:hypothetical protein
MTKPNAAAEDWDLLRSFFPVNWQELAKVTGALKGLRQDKSAESCLRVLLLHLGLRLFPARNGRPRQTSWIS